MSAIITAWLVSIPTFAAPFLLATIGLIVSERAGVLNLGAEGIMSTGAVVAVIVMLQGGGPLSAVLIALVAGSALAVLFGLLVVVLRIDQVLAGLVTVALGVGGSGFIGNNFANKPIRGLDQLPAAWFDWLPPVLGRLLDQDLLTYLSAVLAVAVWWVISRTDLGLRLRAVGEDAPAADAAGVSVLWVRLGAVAVGGLFCALAGAHLALVSSQLWVEGMINGRGWIAVALVTFSRWHPLRAIGAALLFGAVEALIPQLVSSGAAVPVYLIQMTPYLATMAALIGSGYFRSGEHDRPHDLARPFIREERR